MVDLESQALVYDQIAPEQPPPAEAATALGESGEHFARRENARGERTEGPPHRQALLLSLLIKLKRNVGGYSLRSRLEFHEHFRYYAVMQKKIICAEYENVIASSTIKAGIDVSRITDISSMLEIDDTIIVELPHDSFSAVCRRIVANNDLNLAASLGKGGLDSATEGASTFVCWDADRYLKHSGASCVGAPVPCGANPAGCSATRSLAVLCFLGGRRSVGSRYARAGSRKRRASR